MNQSDLDKLNEHRRRLGKRRLSLSEASSLVRRYGGSDNVTDAILNTVSAVSDYSSSSSSSSSSSFDSGGSSGGGGCE